LDSRAACGFRKLAYYAPLEVSTAIRFKANAMNPPLVMTQFDTTQVDMRAKTFIGAGLIANKFTSRYQDNVIVRGDNTMTFDDTKSWGGSTTGVTTARVCRHRHDGRYVFLHLIGVLMGPRHGTCSATTPPRTPGQRPWQTFDTLTPHRPPAEGAGPCSTASTYFIPHLDGVVALLAKAARALPTGYSGCFRST
jgi:hypothetical protein